ncbi:MAG: stage III sporulation protein AG [Oscillospiraceae bacterium]|nr:stage III sporulation protein AG [Oscillospiraceae bacterium]
MKLDLQVLAERIKPYRWPLLILLVGLTLLLLPGERKADEHQHENTSESIEQAEARLAAALEQIEGVGRAEVLLSSKASEETKYLSDEGGTVILSSGSGTQTAVVRQTIHAPYQGAVVVCTGGADAAVRLRVVEAVRQFTGLGAGEISVFPRNAGN